MWLLFPVLQQLDRTNAGKLLFVSLFITNLGSDIPVRSPDVRKKTGCSEWNSQWQTSMKYNKKQDVWNETGPGVSNELWQPIVSSWTATCWLEIGINRSGSSEWQRQGDRNENYKVFGMKMAECSVGKRQELRNYPDICSSLKYCDVTCLSYSLRWCIKNVLKNIINQDFSYFYYSNSSQSTKKANSFYSFLNTVFSKYRA
jgi:hypothetical protein